MATKDIRTAQQLRRELLDLRAQRALVEEQLAKRVSAIVQVAEHPVPYVKQMVKELSGDHDFKKDALSLGVQLASDYLFNRFSFKSAEPVISFITSKLGGATKTASKSGLIEKLIGLVTKHR